MAPYRYVIHRHLFCVGSKGHSVDPVLLLQQTICPHSLTWDDYSHGRIDPGISSSVVLAFLSGDKNTW